MCNPNNPTGLVVTSKEIKQLLDGIPQGMPVLIDEAYHHFVENPDTRPRCRTSSKDARSSSRRTFSKIAALAGMRLGYAIASKENRRQDAAVQHGQHQRARERTAARRRSRTRVAGRT
jgi:histidinol-phosphate aminotransferase